MIQVNIINKSENPLPFYATEESAGMDLFANIPEKITLKTLERKLIPTGIYIELPKGYEAQIRPRSGMALKHGLSVLNAPGTIDSDYRGEIKVLLINFSKDDFTLSSGERIAQMVVAKHEKVQWETVKFLSKTTRNQGGYGSTGK